MLEKDKKEALGFKLLAILPRKGCSAKYRKVLKTGRLYQFYKDYTFEGDSNEEGEFNRVNKITYNPTVPAKMYDQKGVSINVAAIVGKNGSGKSTLIELLYYAVYMLGISLRSTVKEGTVLEPESVMLQRRIDEAKDEKDEMSAQLRDIRLELNKVRGLNTSSFQKMLKSQRLRQKNALLSQNLKERRNEIYAANQAIDKEEATEKELEDNLRLSIFYIRAGVYYELIIDPDVNQSYMVEQSSEFENHHSLLWSLDKGKRQLIGFEQTNAVLTSLFYTISINYSHYALNSNHLGSWINKLFHKNDAYQTPVVINPMRNEGNFDINEENNRALYRLLFNVLEAYQTSSGKEVMLTDEQYIEKIRFQYLPDKVQSFVSTSSDGISVKLQNMSRYNLLSDVQEVFFEGEGLEKELSGVEFPYKAATINYIIRKVQKIGATYAMYKKKRYDFSDNADKGQNQYFLERLRDENSHITFKLKQAVNFLRSSIKTSNPNPWSTPSGYEDADERRPYFDFTLEELTAWMQNDKGDVLDIMNHLPPSIFSIDLILSQGGEESKEKEHPSFAALSSGEQQLIHSVQSVIYHLINVQSAHNPDDTRVAYSAVNIIFDEIELYFHPEYQRMFIHNLLTAISRLNLENHSGVRELNLLFSTHSPFILSDIPGANTLHLIDGLPSGISTDSQTFGANLHDLLANEFYLKNGFMGEFAKQKIEEVINNLNLERVNKELRAFENVNEIIPDKLILRQKEIEGEMIVRGFQRMEYKGIKRVIDLVGEPVIKAKLKNMYYSLLGKESKRDKALEDIRKLMASNDLKTDDI